SLNSASGRSGRCHSTRSGRHCDSGQPDPPRLPGAGELASISGACSCAFRALLAYREPDPSPRGDAVQVPALDTRNSFAQQLFAPLPARYDQLAEILSFGQNARWRRAMVDRLVEALSAAGSTGEASRVVLDVAAGTAGVSLRLAART